MENNKKILLIPGWLNEGGMYIGKNSLHTVLEIWKERLAETYPISADFLICHSLGCNWALLNWKKNKNQNLILVNPLIPKRSIFTWFGKWITFHRREKTPATKKHIQGFRNYIFSIKKCWQLLRYDFDAILNEIPKDKLIVICGEKDYVYCDKIMRDYLYSKNIPIIDMENVEHDWNEKYDKKITEIISSFYNSMDRENPCLLAGRRPKDEM